MISEEKQPAELAYELFEATGNPAYYLLYARIRRNDEALHSARDAR